MSAYGLAQVRYLSGPSFPLESKWNIVFILVMFDGVGMDHRATFTLGKCSELQPNPQWSFLFLNNN